MYSKIQSVQILLSLLKKNNIKDVVLSPGGSDISLIHSFETDSYFRCYSVVDERSAAYFAMGMAQKRKRPCVCVCTSGTAVCNYLPGITEAFYQDVPVVVVTADKNPYYQGQLETQKIEQDNIFNGVIKKAVSVPVVHDEEDHWLCNRLINEALLELDHHGCGPVHINIPCVGNLVDFSIDQLQDERLISRLNISDVAEKWEDQFEKIKKYNKIIVIVGQNVVFSEKDICNMEKFYKKHNCIFAVEHLSNVYFEGCVYTYPVSEMMGAPALEILKPDLVISIGNNTAAYGWKKYLRQHYKEIDNWVIHESGVVRDSYKGLSAIFECSPSLFFELISDLQISEDINHSYYAMWKNELNKIHLPEFELSNFYVAQKLAAVIPNRATLHLAIQYSTRTMHYFKLPKEVETFSNYGALGIDGCLSTFMGQAAATDELSYIIIGDLSFFYDMNAAGIHNIGNNIRIILVNNGGGEEFRFIFNRKSFDAYTDENICACHGKEAGGWIQSLGYEYYCARSKDDVDVIMPKLAENSDRPIVLEVIVPLGESADITKSFYQENQMAYPENIVKVSPVKNAIKNVVKSVVSEQTYDTVKTIAKILYQK